MTTPTVSLPPKLYFRIGEVAGLVGVEPHVLRYWEREFRSIRPTKSAKGQRVYSRKDVEALIVVKDLLYAQGFTIAGAKKRLQRAPDGSRASVPTQVASQAASQVGFQVSSPPQAAPEEMLDDVEVEQAPPQFALGRHAEEALLRTLDTHVAHAAHAAHVPQMHQAQLRTAQAAPAVSRTNGGSSQSQARREVEGTRKALISLRAEVETLLSELGG